MPAAPLTVAELTTLVKDELEATFAAVRVCGEITGFTRAASGHVYFNLTGGGATLRCVMFRGFAFRLKFEPRNGLEVVAGGSFTVYAPRGDYQLQVTELAPRGVGAAELAFQQLKEKLQARGYFAPSRKRRLPRFPVRIGLIASPTGAAVRDMLEILSTRWPVADVIVRPSRVQGPGAAEEIAAAIRHLNRCHTQPGLRLCAIVLGRGGGSAEDLAAFNAEIVAEAVFASTVPVVSAVGHETDVSLADLVADHRALTPSEAIIALCPDRGELLAGLADRGERLSDSVRQRLHSVRDRLDSLAARPVIRRPLDRVRVLEQKLDGTAARMMRAMEVDRTRRQTQVASVAERLAALSPLQVLARGYSLTTSRDDRRLVRSIADVGPGHRLVTRFSDGEVHSEVVRTEPAADARKP